NDYTKYIYPMKLHEYLASGRPTVGTPIASLEPFADVVFLATGVHEWRLALTRALEPSTSSPERCAGRQAVARAHAWDLLVEPVAGTMVGRLAPTSVTRFGGAPSGRAAPGDGDHPCPAIERPTVRELSQ